MLEIAGSSSWARTVRGTKTPDATSRMLVASEKEPFVCENEKPLKMEASLSFPFMHLDKCTQFLNEVSTG
jgi:hypothetical protein